MGPEWHLDLGDQVGVIVGVGSEVGAREANGLGGVPLGRELVEARQLQLKQQLRAALQARWSHRPHVIYRLHRSKSNDSLVGG